MRYMYTQDYLFITRVRVPAEWSFSFSMAETETLLDERDRISNLPLPQLHHILSFLPSKYVVQTCLISKRWKDIWCSIPCLGSNGNEEFTDCFLHQRDGSCSLQALRLSKEFRYSSYGMEDELKYMRCRLDLWILYALRHNVEDFTFGDGKFWVKESYHLRPHQIFSCRSLIELKLSCVWVSVPVSISLPALKVLILHNVDGEIENVLHSVIPNLEILIVLFCSFKKLLSVCSSQLKILRLIGEFPRKLTVSSPNLVSLELELKSEMPDVRFETILQLVDAKIHLPVSRQLIDILEKTQSLTVSSHFLQSLASELQAGKCSIKTHHFSRLRKVQFRTRFSDHEVFAINTLLDHSPRIETILFDDINKAEGEDIEDAATAMGESLEAEKGAWFEYKLHHVKLIEIKGFRGGENEVKLIKFYLESAPLLWNVNIISTSDNRVQPDVLMEIRKELVKYPRASSSIGLFFSGK